MFVGENIFKCIKGGYISSIYVCDDRIDCPFDNSEEKNCVCHISQLNNISIHSFKKLQNYNETGTSLCYLSFDGTYHKYVVKQYREQKSSEQFIVCKSGCKLDLILKNDLVPDCGPEAEDKPILLSLLLSSAYLTCLEPYQLPCKEGHSKCYNMSDICSYKLNYHRHLIPCRNGGHLQNCKVFSCINKFKCQESYCIPWSYVCDGKWDCPDGCDEWKNLAVRVTYNALTCINVKIPMAYAST